MKVFPLCFFLLITTPVLIRAAEAPLPVLGEIKEFDLMERSGRSVNAAELKGRVWIADFFFTHCAGPCPLMSSGMRKLQEELAGDADVRLLSFSVDPERDTPEVLTEYAARYEAKGEKWLFLTGDKKQVYDLAEQHFHLGVGEIPEEEREAADQSVRHSTKFVLLDRSLRIRGYYDSENPQSIEQLIKDAKTLLN